MDKYTTSLLRSLKKHSAVRNVQFETRDPCSPAAISTWEAKHTPYTLPEDLKSFLQACNGMSLRWDVEFKGATQKLACMHINSLSEISKTTLDSYPPEEGGIHPAAVIYDGDAGSAFKGVPEAAFDIDSTCKSGTVALLYFRGAADPQVWFQDLGCTWNYVAPSFTEYYRVLAMYRGLPNWQYAFTKHGLDPVSKRWILFLCPERLAMDGVLQSGEEPPAGDGEEGLRDGAPSGTRKKPLTSSSSGAKAVKGKVRRAGSGVPPGAVPGPSASYRPSTASGSHAQHRQEQRRDQANAGS